MESQHFIGKVAQKAVIEKDGKVLIVRDSRDTSGFWQLPGGRLHRNELPAEGLKREIKEELGVEVKVGSIFYADQFVADFDGECRLLLVYNVVLIDSKAVFVLDPSEIAEIKWIAAAELAEANLYDSMKKPLEVFFDLRDK